MAYREVLGMEIAGVVRRWQAGNSQRNIASGTGLSRDTVRKYLGAAKEAGVVQEGPAPTEDQLSRLAGISRSGPRQSEGPSEELLGPWADQVYRWLNVERLQLTRIRSCWQPEGVRWPTRPCTGSSPAATGGAGAAARSGWRTPRRERWRSGAGLRPSGSDPRPGDGPSPHGVGPDRGAGLLQAQLRLAHLQPETGRRHRRTGGGLGAGGSRRGDRGSDKAHSDCRT